MGCHRYVRFCVDGQKFHSSGTFNDLYEKYIKTIHIGNYFPFELFNIPNFVFDKLMTSDKHIITAIFVRSHSSCRDNRTIYKIWEVEIQDGVVIGTRLIPNSKLVLSKSLDPCFKGTLFNQFRPLVKS